MLAALAASSAAAGSSSAGIIEPPKPPAPESESSGAGVSRRRSQRLRAKKSGGLTDNTPEAVEDNAAPGGALGPSTAGAVDALAREAAPSDTVVNDEEFAADFTDDDVDLDAEVSNRFEIDAMTQSSQVIDDEGDPEDTVPEKTVTVSVGEGMQAVVIAVAKLTITICRWFQGSGPNPGRYSCCYAKSWSTASLLSSEWVAKAFFLCCSTQDQTE